MHNVAFAGHQYCDGEVPVPKLSHIQFQQNLESQKNFIVGQCFYEE